MAFTLKLAHISWDGAPWRWIYDDGDTGVSGPAWCTFGNRAEIEAGAGGPVFARVSADVETLHDGDQMYVAAPIPHVSVPANVRVDMEEVIWRFQDHRGKLPADFRWSKLTYCGNPAHDLVAWHADVKSVFAMGDVDPTWSAKRAVLNGNDPRFPCPPMESIIPWAWMGDEKKTIHKVIGVSFADGTWQRYLVERAWLLGPNGDTIERIAP